MKQPLDPRRIEVVDDRVAEILRRKTPAERVAMVCELNETMRRLIADQFRVKYPSWSSGRIQQEVARHMLDDSKWP